jgi:hypothetical protein
VTVAAIQQEATRRGITRLVHFTPLRNLVHIATADGGLLSTAQLSAADRQAFNPQDLRRLDGHPDHISCSIQYPNAYYLRSKKTNAAGEDRLFPDWVGIYIDPKHLWRDDTLLCTHNASGYGGTAVSFGAETFTDMFADRVQAPRNTWVRAKQPDFTPTDAQAEVLVHRQVPRSDILGLAVQTEDQARDTFARLRQLGAPVADMPIVIAPSFWTPMSLASDLGRGILPVEVPWHPPADERHDGAPGHAD